MARKLTPEQRDQRKCFLKKAGNAAGRGWTTWVKFWLDKAAAIAPVPDGQRARIMARLDRAWTGARTAVRL